MNKLKTKKQKMVIGALVEGTSIRSVERMTGVHRDTITRLMVRVAGGCQKMMDERMQGLHCKRLQMDEAWCYVGKKQRHLTPEDDPSRCGDHWIWVALDPDSKLVPAHRVGKRDYQTAKAFIDDLAPRLANRVQLSTDALNIYVDVIERAFGADVDYGQIVKSYEAEPIGPGRYSPPKVVATEKEVIAGNPYPQDISTSLVERQNLSMRMSIRRMTRLTNAFSKKVENLRAAVALYFAHYNFVRIHGTIKVTPAMEAGVTRRLWSIDDLLELAT